MILGWQRNQERGKTLFAKLTAAEKYLAANRDPKLAARLTQLQTAHSAVSKIVAAIMNTKHEMEVRSQSYIPREEFEARLNLILGQIFAFVRCLAIRVNAYTSLGLNGAVSGDRSWVFVPLSASFQVDSGRIDFAVLLM